MADRRVYRSAEIDSAVNDAALGKATPEPPVATPPPPSKNQTFSRAPQTPEQQAQLQQLLEQQRRTAEALRR